MTYSFCAQIFDEHLEFVTVPDFECEVDVEVTVSGGEVATIINDVRFEGKSLFKGDELSRALAGKVAAAAEANIAKGGSLWADIQAEEGLIYRGLGGNDPDGEWRRVA